MMRMELSAWRLAAAVRVREGFSGAVDESQEALTKVVAAVGLHARRLTTVSLSASPRPGAKKPARTEEAAYARLATKMARVPSVASMGVETQVEKTEGLVQYFGRRLAMKRVTAIETAAQSPQLLTNSHAVLERKLERLTHQGISDKSLHTIVRRHPQILARSEESLERVKQWFLDHGVASSKIPFIFLTAPNVASLAQENLHLKVDFLRDVGLDDNQIRRVLQRYLSVLKLTVENMASKVEGAKSLGLTDGEVVKIVTLTPYFLHLSMDSVHDKLQALDEMFGEGEAVRLWLPSAHLIGRNTEELRRTFEYLTKVVGMTPDRISGNVRLIMRNVDRLVRPRYEYLTMIQSRDVKGVNWIAMPETQFVSRHPGYADFLARDFEPQRDQVKRIGASEYWGNDTDT